VGDEGKFGFKINQTNILQNIVLYYQNKLMPHATPTICFSFAILNISLDLIIRFLENKERLVYFFVNNCSPSFLLFPGEFNLLH
jgi:hypothetical protein